MYKYTYILSLLALSNFYLKSPFILLMQLKPLISFLLMLFPSCSVMLCHDLPINMKAHIFKHIFKLMLIPLQLLSSKLCCSTN